MILRKPRPAQGVCFAWLPVWTDEGKVWWEHVHYQRGLNGYSYRRMLPDETYSTFSYPRAQAAAERERADRLDLPDTRRAADRAAFMDFWLSLPNDERERILDDIVRENDPKLFAEPVRPGD